MKFEQPQTAPSRRRDVPGDSVGEETVEKRSLGDVYSAWVHAAPADRMATKKQLQQALDYERAVREVQFVGTYRQLDGNKTAQQKLRVTYQDGLSEIRFYERKLEGDDRGPDVYTPVEKSEPTALALNAEQVEERNAEWVTNSEKRLQQVRAEQNIQEEPIDLAYEFAKAKFDAAPELFARAIDRGDISIAFDQLKVITQYRDGDAERATLKELLEHHKYAKEQAFVAEYQACGTDTLKQAIARKKYARQLDFLNFYAKKLNGDMSGPDYFPLNDEELARHARDRDAHLALEITKSNSSDALKEAKKEIIPSLLERALLTRNYIGMADQLSAIHKFIPGEYQVYKQKVVATISAEIDRLTHPGIIRRASSFLFSGKDDPTSDANHSKLLKQVRDSFLNDSFLRE